MDEYIKREDAIKVIVNNPYRIAFKTVKTIQGIKEIPTTDVVPKSEVERWRRNLEAVLEEIPETKREFAREIFEEIENALAQMGIEFNCQPILYELKMKYTEGEK